VLVNRRMLKLSVNGCHLIFFDQCQMHETAIKKSCQYGAKTLYIAFPALFRNCLEYMVIQALNIPDPSAVTNFYFCVNLPGNRPDAVGSGDAAAGLTFDISQTDPRDAQFFPHSCNSAFQNRKSRHGRLGRDSRVVQLKLTD
jgi:hypothetical protein